MRLNINTDAVIKFTNKLEKLHKSSLPIAIRGTLNKAAFDVKQNTMLKASDQSFVKRQPNFFKATSRVEMAKGFNMSDMRATVGFTSQGLNGGGNNFAVKDLEQQEYGGTINKKAFIPTDFARGGNKRRPVRPGNRLTVIKRIVNSAVGAGKNSKNRFIKSAIKAGAGGFVLGNLRSKILWKIEAINSRFGRTIIKKRPIYSFKENRNVKVSETGFMRKASIESGKKIEGFYIKEAKRQIEKLK